jgi:hypothetical protein
MPKLYIMRSCYDAWGTPVDGPVCDSSAPSYMEPDGAQADIRHQPRLVSDDMVALRSAAIVGVGIVHLPLLMVGLRFGPCWIT